MSHVTVFIIKPDGDAATLPNEGSYVYNAMACAPIIWSRLSIKLGLRPFGDEEVLWKHFLGGRFTRDEDICLGFTFDAAYVRRENIGALAAALEWFDSTYCKDIVPAIKEVAVILRQLERNTSYEFRGVCFQQTSSSDPCWLVRDGEEEDLRRFNFDRDAIVLGQKPFELIDRVDGKQTRQRVSHDLPWVVARESAVLAFQEMLPEEQIPKLRMHLDALARAAIQHGRDEAIVIEKMRRK